MSRKSQKYIRNVSTCISPLSVFLGIFSRTHTEYRLKAPVTHLDSRMLPTGKLQPVQNQCVSEAPWPRRSTTLSVAAGDVKLWGSAALSDCWCCSLSLCFSLTLSLFPLVGCWRRRAGTHAHTQRVFLRLGLFKSHIEFSSLALFLLHSRVFLYQMSRAWPPRVSGRMCVRWWWQPPVR